MIGRSRRIVGLGVGGGLALLLLGLVSACGSDEEDEYVFFSGGESGVYYPTAQLIARLTNEADSSLELTVQTSGGSVENAQALRDGTAALALIQSDIAAYAREGTFDFDAPIDGIMGLAALYPEHVQIVTLADGGIDSLLDLKGRAVAIGAKGSGTEENARQILEAAELSFDDLGAAEHLSAADSIQALANGDVDAAFFTFGLGTPAIEDLARDREIAFVPVDAEVRQRLLSEYDFYQEATVTAGSYTGLEDDVATVAVIATLVADADVPDEIVETVLEAIFGNLDEFSGGRLEGMTVESAQEGLSLPLHPGAQDFYEAQ